MFDRIIVPLCEDAGLDAVEPALPVILALGRRLTLLHVHCCTEAPSELESLPQYRYQQVVERWDERDAEAEREEVARLESLAAAIQGAEPSLTVDGRVVHAPITRALGTADERLLVVAPAGEASVEGLDLALQEIVRIGGVPVLLVPEGRPVLPLERILVTLDGSHFSTEVLPAALDLARATGAALSLAEVVTRHAGLVRLLHPGERTVEDADRFLRQVRQRIPMDAGAVDLRVVEHASAPDGIAAEAERQGAGLIAMATHGRGGLRRILLGSVAESVIRTSRIPVLLFRPAAVAAAQDVIATEPATTA